MKRFPVIALLAFILAGFSLPGLAADKGPGEQYYPELQNDADMRVIESKKNMLSSGVQYGAWITPVFIYQQTPQSTLATQVTTFRLWFKTYLWDNSYLYLRGKDIYTAVITHRGSGSVKNKNVLDLDLGYIAMASKRKEVDFSVGRKYFLVGSGLVLNGRGDGAEFNYYSKYISIKALGTWTGWLVKDDNPYGLSDRDISRGSRRVFGGGTLSTSWFNQTLYAFGLAQFDFGKEYYNKDKLIASALATPAFDAGVRLYSQRSHYDSQYYGAGLNGVITSGLTYAGEFIMEQGKSYLSGYSIKKSIVAYSGLFKLSYYIKAILKPSFSADYGYGSGDKNRSDYRLPNGNTWAKDRGFIYFGTFVGGYALKPLLANMHMFSGSVSVNPFSWSDIYALNNMTILARYFYYLKDKPGSTINYGLDATRPSRDIGHAVDLSLRWMMLSDFSMFVNYGIFLPGNAFGYSYNYVLRNYTYSSTAKRHFLMAGFNITF
jgi:hypothetical protein